MPAIENGMKRKMERTLEIAHSSEYLSFGLNLH